MRDDQAIPNGVFDCLLQMMQSASPFTGFRLGTCLGLCTEYIILFSSQCISTHLPFGLCVRRLGSRACRRSMESERSKKAHKLTSYLPIKLATPTK